MNHNLKFIYFLLIQEHLSIPNNINLIVLLVDNFFLKFLNIKVTVKTKSKMPIKALKNKTTKANIVKRVTFTVQEFKKIQLMLTNNDCKTLKEWITKRISE